MKEELPITKEFIRALKGEAPCKNPDGINVLVVEDDSSDAMLMRHALHNIFS